MHGPKIFGHSGPSKIWEMSIVCLSEFSAEAWKPFQTNTHDSVYENNILTIHGVHFLGKTLGMALPETRAGYL